MADAKGIEYLRKRLAYKSSRVKMRYQFYEMKNHVNDRPIFDSHWMDIRPALGWCAKAVDSLADRLSFREWKNDNFNLTQIFQMNNPDIFFDSAILSALISSCCFVYIYEDQTGFPRLEVIDGKDATGILDPVTNLLEEGYAVLKRDDNENALLEAHFLPGETIFYPKGEEPYSIKNRASAPLLVPIIYRPDAKRPFGHSRISRAMMYLVEGAVRTVRRSEFSSEFYSFPQKYILGTDPDSEDYYEDDEKAGMERDGENAESRWRRTVSTFLDINKDNDGDKPTVGQFQQQSMQPYTDQIRSMAALFAGESGLTLDDLGFVSDNPSSAEAIKASHEGLRLTAEKAQRTFGACFLNVGYIAACLRDAFPYQRRQFYLTEPVWNPTFRPDAAALSSIGDGAIKINQAVPGYFNKDNLQALTGIAASELPAPVTEEVSNG